MANTSDEDKALFRAQMQGVKPLGQSHRLSFPSPPPPIKKTVTNPQKVAASHHLSNTPQDKVSADAILNHHNPSMPKKRLTQFKKGLIPWEGRLDLHGLRVDAARESLCDFIAYHFKISTRCLLIIHGKGQDSEAPILKNHINHWLQQSPEVLAFHSALPKDGGSGALYVLLKRHRPTVFLK
ncbi:MAG: Smr/MutS family protein [Legionellales bacterium]|nr:Smr/MutS family protein [Legionellales bacterium]